MLALQQGEVIEPKANIESPIYDMFGGEAEDISTDSLQYVEYYDVNLNDADATDEWRLDVREGEQWFLPSRAFLSVKYKIVRKDNGAPFGNGENAAPQSNAVGLFKRWELKLDNEIAEYVDYPGVQNTVQNLVYSGKSALASLEQQHFYKDTISTIDGTDATIELVSDDTANTQTLAGIRAINQGHRARRELCSAVGSLGAIAGISPSSFIVANIPLANVFGVLKSMDSVTKGMKFGVRLDRASPDDCVMAADAFEGKIVFGRVSLWVPRVKPNVVVLSKLESMLAAEVIRRVPFIDTQCFRSNLITRSVNENIYQIKTRRRRPVKVFVCFQFLNRVSPATQPQSRSRRVFDNVGLTSLRAVLNAGVQYPEREYSASFEATDANYGRIYQEFLRCGLRDHDILDGPAVSYQEFKNLFTIYAIDMSEQMEYQVIPDSALVDVYWKTAAAGANYYTWFIVESERKLEIATGNGVMKYINVV